MCSCKNDQGISPSSNMKWSEDRLRLKNKSEGLRYITMEGEKS